MSKLSVGIVGLPNVGKSTLFNALLAKQQAYAANFPFATIEPNIGVVPVPDERLLQLSEVIASCHPELGSGSKNLDSGSESGMKKQLPPQVPATVEFVDIAGLIAGAHKGEGLGNKFLSHIREVDAICHVVRKFKDTNIVKEGSVDPKADLEVIETELMMADFATLEKQKEPKGAASKEEKHRWEAVKKLREALQSGKVAREVALTDEERKAAKELSLLTSKPILVVLNVDEDDLKNSQEVETEFAANLGLDNGQVIAINAKVEEQLAGFTPAESEVFLDELGVSETGLKRLISKAFSTLGLITFLTAGVKEVRAWTIHNGFTGPEAAGVIHTDFEKKYIKAEVVSFDDFLECGGWKAAREKGKVRSEGSEYVVKEGDVIEFRVGR